MTHISQPELREAVALRIKEVQMACSARPRWILPQRGIPFSVGTGMWTQLQLLLPRHTRAILTNHHCDQQGPPVATYTDIHRHPEGKVDTQNFVGATVTIAYIIPTQMRVMAQCGARHGPFLSDPQWPAGPIFQAYLRTCATKAGRTMPGPWAMDAVYKAFEHQHPRPHPNEHEADNDGDTKREEPTPSSKGCTQPTILLLAPNRHKHATRTVQRHQNPSSIHIRNTTPGDRCATSQTVCPRHTTHVLALRPGSARHPMTPTAPHLNPLSHPYCRHHR